MAPTSPDWRLRRSGIIIFVDFFDCLQDAHLVAVLLGGLDECLHVLGEAASTVAAARIKELRTDTCVATILVELVDLESFFFCLFLINRNPESSVQLSGVHHLLIREFSCFAI